MTNSRTVTLNYLNYLHEERPDQDEDVYWSRGKIMGEKPNEEPSGTQESSEFNRQFTEWPKSEIFAGHSSN